jgi:hypothetical protein
MNCLKAVHFAMHLTTASSTNVSQHSLTFLHLFHYTAITRNCRYFATDVAVNSKWFLCFIGHLSTMTAEVELGTTCWSTQQDHAPVKKITGNRSLVTMLTELLHFALRVRTEQKFGKVVGRSLCWQWRCAALLLLDWLYAADAALCVFRNTSTVEHTTVICRLQQTVLAAANRGG